jgi:thioredoxin-like negative regulator of GroEL
MFSDEETPVMDFRTCIEEGKKALSEGRMADARRWFESAAKLNPQDWEANLQFALSALLCGDRRTFESVLAARQAPPEESSPRVHQLWRTALRFAGSLATAAAIVAAVPACSSSSRESAATTASSGDKPQPRSRRQAKGTGGNAGRFHGRRRWRRGVFEAPLQRRRASASF